MECLNAVCSDANSNQVAVNTAQCTKAKWGSLVQGGSDRCDFWVYELSSLIDCWVEIYFAAQEGMLGSAHALIYVDELKSVAWNYDLTAA